jgi:RNA polymerase sigma-70 factor (ECF subfamily)
MSEISTADRAAWGPIVERAAAGDEAAFAEIIATHHVDLRRIAWVITGDQDLAEDAVQQAWLIAWRRLGTIRDPQAVRGWLVAIAANEARKVVNQRRRRIAVEGRVQPLAVAAEVPDPDVLDLGPVLERLAVDDRELLALRYVAGLDSFEIAALRGGSASGVRARLARLLARLRTEFDHG